MSFVLYNPLGIGEYDLTTPTSTQGTYPVGTIAVFQDSDYPTEIKSFMYVKAHAALTQYQPYTVVGSNSTTTPLYVTAAPATLASGVTVCVPQVAFTSGYYGWVQISGRCSALLANETHVQGDYLELLNTGTTLIVDGTSGSTAFSAKSVAILLATVTGAGTGTVNLFSSYRTALVSAS